jgi:hypothetical protein
MVKFSRKGAKNLTGKARKQEAVLILCSWFLNVFSSLRLCVFA